MLTGERVLTARKGDLIVVPPGTVHALAAAPAAEADKHLAADARGAPVNWPPCGGCRRGLNRQDVGQPFPALLSGHTPPGCASCWPTAC